MSNEDNKQAFYITEILTNLTKFQYEKAKSCVDKSKDINCKIWSLFQNVFTHLINGEKSYNNLLFLNQKSISKMGDKSYEPAFNLLEQITREISTKTSDLSEFRIRTSTTYDSISLNSNQQSASGDQINLNEFIEQLIQFIDFRFQMMTFYFDMKDREVRQEKFNLQMSLNQLVDIEAKYNDIFTHTIIEPFKQIQCLELNLIKNLLQCHLALDFNINPIRAIVCLKEINNIFNNKLPMLNNKQSKESKGFSLFSRSSSQQRLMPILYQWFKLYHQNLLKKFSLVMHDSLQMISDVDHIMLEKIDLYAKMINYIKKFLPVCTGLLLDAQKVKMSNFRGAGYEMTNSDGNPPEKDQFHIIFVYPNGNEIEKHSKNLLMLVTSDFDQRSKYHYDQNLKSTYYLCKTSKLIDNYTFFMVFEQNKQENKTKTSSFVQEISDELNTNRIFDLFNSTLK